MVNRQIWNRSSTRYTGIGKEADSVTYADERAQGTFFFFFFFFLSHLLFSPFYSLSLLVVTQIRGHIAGSSPPLPTTVRALHFYREKILALSSLVDSRRNRTGVVKYLSEDSDNWFAMVDGVPRSLQWRRACIHWTYYCTYCLHTYYIHLLIYLLLHVRT